MLYGSAALAGILPADMDDNMFALFRTFHDLRLKRGYEIHYWPELCPVEQRYYRAAYLATETITAGDERYFVAAQKYYLAIRGQSPAVQAPATLDSAGQWQVNAAYWAECATSFEGVSDWSSGVALVEGDQRRNIYDGRYYQCHTAHTTGADFDATKFGELVAFAKYIPYDGTGTALAAASGIPSGIRRTGTLALANGVDSGSVTGLALSFTPTVVLAWVTRPAGGLNLTAAPVAGTFTADGFNFELTGLTDSTSYVLNYVLVNDPLVRTLDLGSGVDSGTVSGLGLSFTPAQVNAWVIKPSGGLNLTASVVTASITSTGFDFDLSGLTDSAGYVLAYEILPAAATATAATTTPLGTVRRVCQKNPRVFRVVKEYDFTLSELGVHVPLAAPNVVWVEFRWRRPTLKGGMWDSATVYTSGQQVYFSATTGGVGNFYEANATTAAGESPSTTPAKWDVVPLPELLRDYCIRGGYADWLRADGQTDRAEAEEDQALAALEAEADLVQRQQKQVRRFHVA